MPFLLAQSRKSSTLTIKHCLKYLTQWEQGRLIIAFPDSKSCAITILSGLIKK